MKWIKLFEEFQLGDLDSMSPEEIQDLFLEECSKQTPDINLIRVIVENGLVDINAKHKDKRLPLNYAVGWNNVELTKLLIKAGADVNAAKEGDGNSPLHWAAMNDNIAIAKLLIKAGADVNAKNGYNEPIFAKSYEMRNLLKAGSGNGFNFFRNFNLGI